MTWRGTVRSVGHHPLEFTTPKVHISLALSHLLDVISPDGGHIPLPGSTTDNQERWKGQMNALSFDWQPLPLRAVYSIYSILMPVLD